MPGGYLRLFADREGANVVASDHDCTSLTGESNSNCVLQFFFSFCACLLLQYRINSRRKSLSFDLVNWAENPSHLECSKSIIDCKLDHKQDIKGVFT